MGAEYMTPPLDRNIVIRHVKQFENIESPLREERSDDFEKQLFCDQLVMHDPPVLSPEEIPNARLRKKKALTQVAPMLQQQGENVKEVQEKFPSSFKTKQKVQKRNLKNKGSSSFQQPERSTSDSLPDSSRSANDYRALRHKYLLLEEKSSGLGRELREVEDEVKALTDEKLALLDQLLVLEGLIDPLELQPRGAPL
ncbi:hypothetical protein NE237_018897 [Protea cynaroides]|uniref:Uncharacterized protein n=1 Tax=Protea cynaroides TaxID=273540 RepID=A0A9Q0QPG4_9MAGN|nr:hypothetical protein NE237_018897 [Protea cynaroides]